MKHHTILLIFLLTSLTAWSFDSTNDADRLSGFAEHKQKVKDFEKDRDRDEVDFFREKAEWEKQRKKDLEAYRKLKKEDSTPKEFGLEHREWQQEKKAQQKEAEENRSEESRARKAWLRTKKNTVKLTEAEELELNMNRDRYDYQKRSLYGGRMKIGKWTLGSGSSAGSSKSSSNTTMPTPSYDGFGDGGGYIPPPPMPEPYYDPSLETPPTMPNDFGGDLAPPPPPAPPMDDGFMPGE